MNRTEALASMLLDGAIIDALVPWSCPCDFGPEARYRLEELIAAGRNSLVYRATDRHLCSEGFTATVAIKIIRSGDTLAREALAARRIGHPNVLAVFDHGVCDDGAVYVVSEYIASGDLSGAQVPWDARAAAAFVIKLARAVHAAHSAGVVHCDLKPANILITESGEPKLVDFDLARWGSDEGGPRGNLAFMSPEQFNGGPTGLTPPSDLYALGGILYYLLTGRLPNGETPADVSASLTSGRRVAGAGVECDLDRIVGRALEADREVRHHSAGELADDLQRWLDHEPVPWTRPGPVRRAWLLVRRRPVHAVVAVAAMIGVCAAAAVLQYNAVKARQETARIEAETQRRTQREVEETRARARAGIRFFAQSALAGGTSDLQDRVLPTLVWMQLLGDSPVLSDDARIPTAAEREHLLRVMVEEATAGHRDHHLDAVLAKYALAYFLVDGGESGEPLELLSDVRDQWGTTLAPDDPLWASVRGLELCCAANSALAGGAPLDVVRRDLQSARAAAERDGRCEPVRRLAGRLLARLSKR